MLAELKLLQDCRSRGFESHYIRLTVNIRYIDLISKVFQKFGFYVRPSVSFALSVIQIYILPFSPLDHRLLSSRRHYVQETSQLLQKPVYFSSVWGQPTFLFFTAGSSSVTRVSCRQVVDIRKPSAYRFRPLVAPLRTNF